jgi:hypothetical protein
LRIYQVKNRFQNVPYNRNLHRYMGGIIAPDPTPPSSPSSTPPQPASDEEQEEPAAAAGVTA